MSKYKNQMYVSKAGGLIQETTLSVGDMRGQVLMRLPLFLTVELWQRHKYSLGDIEKTIFFFSPGLLWQAALLFGIYPVTSAIKLSFSKPSSLIFSAKSIVCSKIMNRIKMTNLYHTFAQNRSVLDMKREQHVPPIPIHKIKQDLFAELAAHTPEKITCLLKPICVDKVFTWSHIKMVPLWYEEGAIYCVRIIGSVEYDEIHCSQRKCLATRPIQINCGSTEYVGLEESWLVEPKL